MVVIAGVHFGSRPSHSILCGYYFEIYKQLRDPPSVSQGRRMPQLIGILTRRAWLRVIWTAWTRVLVISRLTTFSADVSRLSIEVGNLVVNRLRTAALREAALDSMD